MNPIKTEDQESMRRAFIVKMKTRKTPFFVCLVLGWVRPWFLVSICFVLREF